jgi:hypothetical protein
MRSTLRLGNGMYEFISAFVVNPPINSLTIVGGRNAIFQRTTPGLVLQVKDGSTLTLRGISINNTVACSNFAHLNVSRASLSNASLSLSMCSASVTGSEITNSPLDGISMSDGDELTVTGTRISGSIESGIYSTAQHTTIIGSTISGNGDLGIRGRGQTLSIHKSALFSNYRGGVKGTGGIVDITNNFIFLNGNDTSSELGGLALDTVLPGNRVMHNTITGNHGAPLSEPTTTGGFYCRGGGSFINNLIVGNYVVGSATHPNAQVGGTCDFTGSQIANEVTGSHFVSPEMPPYDYHLAGSASSALNAGMIGPAPETEDFDGDARGDGHPDVGADELKP